MAVQSQDSMFGQFGIGGPFASGIYGGLNGNSQSLYQNLSDNGTRQIINSEFQAMTIQEANTRFELSKQQYEAQLAQQAQNTAVLLALKDQTCANQQALNNVSNQINSMQSAIFQQNNITQASIAASSASINGNIQALSAMVAKIPTA